jgi:hypothetical protein
MDEVNQNFKEKMLKTTKVGGTQKREKRVEKIKNKNFNQEIKNKQKSRILKRDAVQTKINRRLQNLASKLEKEKIIEEKRQLKDFNVKLAEDKRNMTDAFTKFFDDQISVTKEQIEVEKQNRLLIEQAETKQLYQWKKEVNRKQKHKLDKYLSLLEQEDERYEVENMDLSRMEEKLIKLYKNN